jgi:hypothetical protein
MLSTAPRQAIYHGFVTKVKAQFLEIYSKNEYV